MSTTNPRVYCDECGARLHSENDKGNVTLWHNSSCSLYPANVQRSNADATAVSGTAEAHHDRLMKEIDHEIDTYGVASIAGIIASLLDARCDTDDNSPTAAHYREARRIFEATEERLARLARPFALPVVSHGAP